MCMIDINEVLREVDFVINVEAGRNPIVLQLTDTQIIDSSQQRMKGRLSSAQQKVWAPDQIYECCYKYLSEIIKETKPDLILLTGDLVYGEFDDAGSMLKSFVMFMESFSIPWAPVFGNHDNDSKKGVDWQCKQFEDAKYCLFKQRKLTGNGNYTVGILQNQILTRVFFMLDSNGCGVFSEKRLTNGHSVSYVGFGQDQITWYTRVGKKIKKISPKTKISFAFHIQPHAFADAFEKYGFKDGITQACPINIDLHKEKRLGDFGYLGADLKNSWDRQYDVWNTFKEIAVDSLFVGHEHCNSASVIFDGIRCQYGQKSSTYDRNNYVDTNGSIFGAYCSQCLPIVGGTVIPLTEGDGTIAEPYIYLCKGENK